MPLQEEKSQAPVVPAAGWTTPGAWLASEMPKECLEDFAVDWCDEIRNGPRTMEVPFQSRTITRNSTLHSLFNRTLATLDTLRACQAFVRVRDAAEGELEDAGEKGKKKEAFFIASMGSGLDGHPGLAHGGTVGILFDEGLSLGALQVLPRAFFTATTEISFKKAIPTPGLVLVRSWCTKTEGRKAWIEGSMEDGKGNVYATAKCLYIMPREEKM